MLTGLSILDHGMCFSLATLWVTMSHVVAGVRDLLHRP